MALHVYAIGLGGNVGDPERSFKRALNLMERDGDVFVLRRSSWHATEAVGPRAQASYTNGAVLVESPMGPSELLAHLQRVEAHLGRDRASEERFGPRVIDLDILFSRGSGGDAVAMRTPELVLPHPRMEERPFVLAPLAEIAPDHVLARSGLTVAEQLERVTKGGGLVALESVDAGRAWCAASCADGGTLGFVATMGALHDGHLELVRRAARENDRVCVSVFVNPLQFNDPKDLERYPRDFAGDARMLAGAGCSMVFTGTLDQFFPDGIDGAKITAGVAAVGLEGEFRPGHFDGVATIVRRLFEVTAPTRAYFGAKDFQQCLVVEEVADDMGEAGPEVVRCPIVRSPRGLALSSRNALLSEEGLEDALVLSAALKSARAAWRKGLRDAEALTELLHAALDRREIELEYAEVRDPAAWTSEVPTGLLERAVALVAGKVAGVRLLDNMELHTP